MKKMMQCPSKKNEKKDQHVGSHLVFTKKGDFFFFLLTATDPLSLIVLNSLLGARVLVVVRVVVVETSAY